MLRTGLLLFFTWSFLNDPLLQIIYSTPTYQEKPKHEEYESDFRDEDFRSDSSYENGEHYSWDNLYLCQYCETEVIVNPYE